MIDDERLLAELHEALRTADEVPDEFIAAGRAAFAWRTVDAELAALAGESSADEVPAGVRAEHATVRALSFRAANISIELEVTAEAILGQVVPPAAGRVEVQAQAGAEGAASIDETGWFTIRPLPSTMFRLHLSTASGDVVTEWITL